MNFSTLASRPPQIWTISYRRYLKSAIVGFLACWLLFFVAAFAQIGVSTPGATWIAGLYATKSRLAGAINQPKMVIVGGSSSLFGISAQEIQQATQLPTINLGTHAGLGIDYLLHRSKELVKPGDTVLLAPEYELYMADYKQSNTLVGYVFAHDPAYILQRPQVLLELSLERVLYGVAVKSHLLPQVEATGGYDDKDLNSNGDTIANRESQIGPTELAKLASLEPFRIKSSILDNPAVFHKLKEYVDWCHKQNINVIATWPNTVWFDMYAQPKYQSLFQNIQMFYQTTGVPIVGQSRDFMYDKSSFFDTIYHLHDRATTARTQQLVGLLKPVLASRSPQLNQSAILK